MTAKVKVEFISPTAHFKRPLDLTELAFWRHFDPHGNHANCAACDSSVQLIKYNIIIFKDSSLYCHRVRQRNSQASPKIKVKRWDRIRKILTPLTRIYMHRFVPCVLPYSHWLSREEFTVTLAVYIYTIPVWPANKIKSCCKRKWKDFLSKKKKKKAAETFLLVSKPQQDACILL